MTENTGSKLDSFQKKKNKEEMQQQLISFALMIVFTILAFVVVITGMDKMIAIPILITLAVVQVGFQFYYFMHMKHEGHEMAAVMIYGGVWAALLTLAGLTVITWW
ncbi:cytochrome c oxidase subunit IVB [Virgibacillus dakarensis]|uniref:Cytochrome c oxidase subunit 4B n=1 Tax=Lentibacillus populi TaxID=1827502 RepID=A0A9W5TYE4_9BACI|nr:MULTISPECIES: cytochrome c oxidase subunit IVB [Bacillaceae]MBT2216160.1 cytochrome c oxidase subunit IVB [Virgibacillus dakarensis]MTW85372.1 cytochrome c oxidase subunit IVB [Virgibacillus dakarensis]GGB44929.1 cytochrome c oxidase subunit 4B [Lentibacillus populi]